MYTIRLLLRIIGYTGLGLFFIQILNLYIDIFKPSEFWIRYSFVTGIASLFILVLVDRFTNKEDKYYSNKIEK
jgi:intracellular septation protein A